MTKKEVQLGLGEKGVTKYWSSNCNKVRLEYYRIYCNFFNVKWSTIVNNYHVRKVSFLQENDS